MAEGRTYKITKIEDERLKLGYRCQSFILNALPEAAPHGCVCVRAEVESIMPEYAFQQQLDLDTLELGAVGNRRTVERTRRAQRYSHTRIRLSSCSVSTGFVM